MIEIDTKIIRYLDLNIDQLVFISFVENDNQKINQDVLEIISRIDKTSIQNLVERELITIEESEEGTSYDLTDKFYEITGRKKDMFTEFYDAYPVYITRTDGTKDYLRTNAKRCEKQYKKIVGKNRLRHEHIMECLKYDISEKMKTGKIGYMKRMWNWLTSCEWEVYEEQMKQQQLQTQSTYGTEVC